MFVNRTAELSRLHELYNSEDAELAVIFKRYKASASGLDPEGEADI